MTIRSLAIVLLLFVSSAPAAEQTGKHTFQAAGLRRTFYLYSPAMSADTPPPLLLALHGSHGRAEDMIESWMPIAGAAGLMVVAPVARQPAAWQIRADGPQFMRALVDEVERLHPIDRRRIYLFGYSGGAVFALTLSMLESEHFAATAVYAGAWRQPNEFIAVPHARRAIPVAIFVGERDEYFRLHDVRKTYEVLQEAGHPSNLTILPGRTHSYGNVAREVNEAAWDWLKVYRS